MKRSLRCLFSLTLMRTHRPQNRLMRWLWCRQRHGLPNARVNGEAWNWTPFAVATLCDHAADGLPLDNCGAADHFYFFIQLVLPAWSINWSSHWTWLFGCARDWRSSIRPKCNAIAVCTVHSEKCSKFYALCSWVAIQMACNQFVRSAEIFCFFVQHQRTLVEGLSLTSTIVYRWTLAWCIDSLDNGWGVDCDDYIQQKSSVIVAMWKQPKNRWKCPSPSSGLVISIISNATLFIAIWRKRFFGRGHWQATTTRWQFHQRPNDRDVNGEFSSGPCLHIAIRREHVWVPSTICAYTHSQWTCSER